MLIKPPVVNTTWGAGVGTAVGVGVAKVRVGVAAPGAAVALGAVVAAGAAVDAGAVVAAGAWVAAAGTGVDVADAPQATAITKSKAPKNGKTVLMLIICRFNISTPLCSVDMLIHPTVVFYPR